ncbi:hypothetical protein PHYPSEUDO_008427 [Phytophthora pseudosyringae]|uniref:Uncharacterized protein n=1 Tax=Phytophthora pseudosyringae TaxID=221518 RepID=A0A8T1WF92_9STRA|nr:hypothetical protein PHYPSEUDO_008427 [Phytophthora pseudosyringae]
MATDVSRLLVLGPDLDSKLAVISKLRELCGDSDADAAKSDVPLLSLQTKYYRATVELHVHQVLDNAPEPALQHDLHEYEAVVCVVDASQRESFLHVHRFAQRIVETLPYDVCLLVAGTSSATNESVQKMEGWCQDNGFEFVDLDADADAPSDDTVIDEKQGIERVLEALHCNMWRSMDMNPPKAESATSSELEAATPEVTAVETKKKAGETEEKTVNQAQENEKNGDEEEQDAAANDSRLQALLQALEIAGDATEGAGAGGEGDEDDNVDMTQFSALISEVRDVRDQGQSLTDEQRRERAAEVAMKLWTFLGADGDADVSDSD